MSLTFNAIDVETANSDPWSICQIGIATFYNGTIIDTWSSLINPNTLFDWRNIRVHGIKPKHVNGQPTFCDVQGELKDRLENTFIVSHTLFDLKVITSSWDFYDLEQFQFTWLDSCKIAKYAWAKSKNEKGYGLKALAERLEISFNHHDALEDAIVSGKITVAACSDTNLSLEQIAELGL